VWMGMGRGVGVVGGRGGGGGGAGHWAGWAAPSAVQARLAGDHHVAATLLRDVPTGPDQQLTLGLGLAKARWAGPGSSVRTGYVQAPPGTRAGSTLQPWPHPPPPPTPPPPPLPPP